MSDNLWKSLITEFIVTFLFLFIGLSAVALAVAEGGSIVVSSLAFGFAFLALFYAASTYSGAHMNPATSFGFFVSGRMNGWLMIGYWIAQLLAAVAAGALVLYFFGSDSGTGAAIGTLTYTDAWRAVLLEAILTFILVLVILVVTAQPMLAMASGLAIGVILSALMFAGYYLTGASMNPARSLGGSLFSSNMGSYWIYVVGPLIGALVAGLLYRIFATDWSCCTLKDECGKPILDECGNPIKQCTRPMLDACGKPIKDCNGVLKETYIKHEPKQGYKQANWMSTGNDLLSQAGLNPQYAQDQLQKVFPTGVVTSTPVISTPVEAVATIPSPIGRPMPTASPLRLGSPLSGASPSLIASPLVQ